MLAGSPLTIKALSLRQLTKAKGVPDLIQAIADVSANQNAFEQTIRSIIDFLNAGSGGGRSVPMGTASQTIFNVTGGAVGSDATKFRLVSQIQKTASVTTAQNVLTGGDGFGDRSVPISFWAPGKRLVLAIPIDYSLEDGTEVTIAVKLGSNTIHTMTRVQAADRDLLLLIFDVVSLIGSALTLTKRAEWFSNFNPDVPGFSTIAVDASAGNMELQIAVTFSVADMVSQIRFQNLDFQGIAIPSAW